MEDSFQNATLDQYVSYAQKVLRQSCEDYSREVFAIDDLTLRDGNNFGSKRSDEAENPAALDYRTLYRELSKKLKEIVQENEHLRNKLRNWESKLLQVQRDRNTLLERLSEDEDRSKSSSSECNNSKR